MLSSECRALEWFKRKRRPPKWERAYRICNDHASRCNQRCPHCFHQQRDGGCDQQVCTTLRWSGWDSNRWSHPCVFFWWIRLKGLTRPSSRSTATDSTPEQFIADSRLEQSDSNRGSHPGFPRSRRPVREYRRHRARRHRCIRRRSASRLSGVNHP